MATALLIGRMVRGELGVRGSTSLMRCLGQLELTPTLPASIRRMPEPPDDGAEFFD
ncbi:MAG TPA: hypothetical protein VGC51_11370 [Hansschlegelia sp.]